MERMRTFVGTSGATLECQTTSLEVGERAWKVKTRTSRNSGNHACGLAAQAGPKNVRRRVRLRDRSLVIPRLDLEKWSRKGKT